MLIKIMILNIMDKFADTLRVTAKETSNLTLYIPRNNHIDLDMMPQRLQLKIEMQSIRMESDISRSNNQKFTC